MSIETLASLAVAAGHALPEVPVRRARALASPAFDATSSSRARGWNPQDTSINDLLFANLEALRAKSRDMARRNAYAANAIEAFVGNAIGTGIVPRVKHPDPREKARIQELWLRWTDESDADGLTDFYGQQSLACRTGIESGECIARLRPRRLTDGLTVPLQIQLLQPDHLPLYLSSGRAKEGNKIRYGIEFDGIGRRVAYHLYRENPSETFLYGKQDISRVPVENILHLYKPLQPGQQRGQPWLTPVLATLYDLERYDTAELIRKKLAAMVVAFEISQDPSMDATAIMGAETGADGVPEEGLEPGAYYSLPNGKKVEWSNPADVGGMYPEFMSAQLHKIAAGVGIPYEVLTGDLNGVTYSSIRSGALEFRRRCEAFQHQVMVYQFCRPIWTAWILSAVLAGKIDARDFERNPHHYLDVEWRPQAWKWVDPVKDVTAEVLAIDNLLKSRSASIGEAGYDREDVDQQIQEDQQSEQSRGLQRGEKSAARTSNDGEDQTDQQPKKTPRRIA